MVKPRVAITLLSCLACLPNALAFSPLNIQVQSHQTRSKLLLAPPPSPPDIKGGTRSFYEGLPSSPGWKSGQLETLVKWSVNERANRPVIREYEPDALWLWTRWNGTVLKLAFVPVFFNVLVGVGVDAFVHRFAESSWPLLSIPPADDAMIQQLEGLNKLWGYQVTLTTFILTFFTGMFPWRLHLYSHSIKS